MDKTQEALKQEPELEPDAWDRCEGVDRQCRSWCGSRRCVSHWRETSPPASKPWVGLTDEQISDLWDGHTVPVFGKTGINPIVFARAIEAKLKEKNA